MTSQARTPECSNAIQQEAYLNIYEFKHTCVNICKGSYIADKSTAQTKASVTIPEQ